MPIHFNAGVYAIAVLFLLYDLYKIIAGEYSERDKLYLVGYVTPVIGWLIYVSAFLLDDFSLYDVYIYSSRSADLLTKLSSSWSGGGGFIIWMTMALALLLLYYRLSSLSVRGEFDEKRVYLHVVISNVSLVLLIAAIFTSDAFNVLDITPADGLGLNPILKTFWNYIHPPSAILAYTLGLAVGIWAFSGVSEGSTKFLASFAWLWSTAANFIGGVWSYYTLGWGGYWAWDPVETGMLLTWLVLTAYFHATYLGRSFRRALLLLTGFSVAFAGYITRGGAVSPLHGFVGMSWTGVVLVMLGLPFLIYALRLFRAVDYSKFFSTSNKTHEFSMNMGAIAIIGIFIVCIVGLASQSLYLIFTGKEIQISVDYYNYLSAPFAVIFLIFLSGCTLEYLYPDTVSFMKNIAIPTSIISIILGLLTYLRILVFSPLSSIYTNILVATLLPFAVISLISAVVYLGRMLVDKAYVKIGQRILHLSVPLLFVAILLSGPFAYNQAYFKNILISSDEPVYVSGVGLRIRDVEFRGPIGWIALPGAESVPNAPLVPEEVECIVHVETTTAVSIPVKIRFNFGSFIRGMGAIVAEPATVDMGLDQIYIVASTASSTDLFYYYASFIDQIIMESNDNMTKTILSHLILFLANAVGVEPNTFYSGVKNWSPDKSPLRNSFVAHVKIVPKISLVWLSGVLLLIGEVVTIIFDSPLGRRWRLNE